MVTRSDTVPRVFVTGLSGFTGSYLRERFAADGWEVRGTGREVADGVMTCDLFEKSRMTEILSAFRPDYVVHLAAIAFVGHGAPDAFYNVNVLGTEALFEAIVAADVQPRKVLVASSANIYGNATILPINEKTPPAPTNHYAISKFAMELMLRNWFDRLPIIVARPFNYTGFGQSESFLVPKIVSAFSRGDRALKLGNLDVARDFSDVRYVVDAYARLLSADIAGETVNICSGKAYSLRDVVAAAEAASGRSIVIESEQHLRRAGEVSVLYGTPERLAQLIGDLSPVGLDALVRNMYQQYLHAAARTGGDAPISLM
ncbi:GDP-mannose 4,6-dehydratase [Pandoraea cepalis]|uniref:dTDP-glucose 4,6-dehydratase n=1 Tax=Pandoraea cepalis TaxID=2508294 RepID=A0A5E4XG81_9BURK|nr:GDP-mannose 4,6-dehydratase [Pandoraea cepalis]VVE35140.1 dTDP-glucose 4,6-dehydratase [Pandoraea cepalis]